MRFSTRSLIYLSCLSLTLAFACANERSDMRNQLPKDKGANEETTASTSESGVILRFTDKECKSAADCGEGQCLRVLNDSGNDTSLCTQLTVEKTGLNVAPSRCCPPVIRYGQGDCRNCGYRSSVKLKKDIRYLSDADKDGLRDQVLGIKLAEFRYKEENSLTKPATVGFMIEDQPKATFVDVKEGVVNSYSLISAAVATIQQQQKDIEQLKLKLAKIQEEKSTAK